MSKGSILRVTDKIKIDESYAEKLDELIGKKDLTLEEINALEEISKQVWKNRCSAASLKSRLKYENPTLSDDYEGKELDFLKLYSEISEHIGASLEKIKPTSRSHYLHLKVVASEKYITSLQCRFEFLQAKNIKSELSNKLHSIAEKETDTEVEIINSDVKTGCLVIEETDSPYYKVKKLLKYVEVIYDDLALCYLSGNYTHEAYEYYYFLGEVLTKEIYYSNILNDSFLYDEEEKAFLYRSAGEAFLRAYKAINDKHIVVFYSPPMSRYLHSNISNVFGTENIIQPPEQLSIFCFEIAKELFRAMGYKKYYLEARDKLYELKAETNDFEFNISRLFVEISKIFVKNKAPFLKMLDGPENIQEEHVRDYFMSHVNLMIEDISVAESLKARGRSDLTIFGKDNFGKILEAIAEFKVWGRNASSKDHSYKNVLNQLRIYMSDFEEFGIVVMINRNKSSIKDKYIQNIIKKDKYFTDGSIEEPYSEGAFINLKSEHYVESDNNKRIKIYHFILNIQSLFFDK